MVALKHMEWNNGYECYYSAKYPKKIREYKNTVGDVKEYTSFGFCTVKLKADYGMHNILWPLISAIYLTYFWVK